MVLMRISNASTSVVNFNLIKNVECGLCLESVTEKVKKIKEGSAFFYGYEHKVARDKSTFFHLICEDCNLAVIKFAVREATYRKCISCSAFPAESREKFTVQIENSKKMVTREFVPLPSEAFLSKDGLSYVTGIVMGIFIATISSFCAKKYAETYLGRSFVALSLGSLVGMLLDKMNPGQIDLNLTSKALFYLGCSLCAWYVVDSEYHSNQEPVIFNSEMAYGVLSMCVGMNILKMLQD